MRKIIFAFLIVVLALPLSALVALAQPSDTVSAPLGLPEVKLWSDSATPLANTGSLSGLGSSRTLGFTPDLTVSGITFNPSVLTTENVITITATISNMGTASARNVVVRFYTNGTVKDKTISSIGAGGSAAASITLGPVATYTVTVVVDPLNRIAESDENNNARSADITVGTPPPPSSGDKWALLIGISDYQGTANDLWNPANDALDMQTALTTKYGFPADHIEMLLNSNATASAIVNAIGWLAANEGPDSTVVFLFSGHGFRVSDSSRWDTDREADGYDEGIVSYDMYGLVDGYLKSLFSGFETKKFALIFGSCYSGGMFDDVNDLQAPGRVICSACKANQYGWDYSNLGNTLFGYYFVDRGILNGLADSNGDSKVSMEEARAYAYPLVTAMQSKSQPQIYDGFTGELIP